MTGLARRTFLAGLGAAAGAVVVAACSGTKKTPVTTASTAGSSDSAGPPTSVPASVAPAPSAPQGPAAFLAHGPASSKGVALTFHTAGDPTVTEDLLAQAANLGAHLTFFVVGTWATANPSTVQKMLAGGHELGNHTWSHINIGALSPDQMLAEIQKCADTLQRETGSISKWFRPSQTDVPSAAILEQAGKVGYATSVGYDVDPLDYTNPGAALIESRVRSRLHGGAIVSLHTLYPGTATAFGPMVSAIRAQGLEAVTTSAVLSGRA